MAFHGVLPTNRALSLDLNVPIFSQLLISSGNLFQSLTTRLLKKFLRWSVLQSLRQMFHGELDKRVVLSLVS